MEEKKILVEYMCRILVSKLCVSTALLINKMRNELNKKYKK